MLLILASEVTKMIARYALHITSLAIFLGGCASEHEMEKRRQYQREKPPCSYDEYIWAPPFVHCEGQQYPPERTEPKLKADPNDTGLQPVPPVV